MRREEEATSIFSQSFISSPKQIHTMPAKPAAAAAAAAAPKKETPKVEAKGGKDKKGKGA